MFTLIVYIAFVVAFSALIWRVSKRDDVQADILEVAPRTRLRELVGVFASAGLLAVIPTLFVSVLVQ